MTREEQIEHQASEYANDSNNTIEWGDGWEDYNDFDQVFDAFKNGAKWVDENPQFLKEEFIEKACKPDIFEKTYEEAQPKQSIIDRATDYAYMVAGGSPDIVLAGEAYQRGAEDGHRLLTEWHDARERPDKDGTHLLKCPSKDGFFYSVGKYCYESDTWDCGIYHWQRTTSKLRFSHWRPIHEMDKLKMKYQIKRASDWKREKKPCSQAVYEGKDEFNDNIWTIEINSLADLHALMNEVGKIVIYPENEIKIYDDYID